MKISDVDIYGRNAVHYTGIVTIAPKMTIQKGKRKAWLGLMVARNKVLVESDLHADSYSFNSEYRIAVIYQTPAKKSMFELFTDLRCGEYITLDGFEVSYKTTINGEEKIRLEVWVESFTATSRLADLMIASKTKPNIAKPSDGDEEEYFL